MQKSAQIIIRFWLDMTVSLYILRFLQKMNSNTAAMTKQIKGMTVLITMVVRCSEPRGGGEVVELLPVGIVKLKSMNARIMCLEIFRIYNHLWFLLVEFF